MRCRTCGFVVRVLDRDNNNHHWDYLQCVTCHYFGVIKSNKHNSGRYGKSKIRAIGYKTSKSLHKEEHHKIRITNSNIELYCKLSQIIRDKPCIPNLVLATQDNGSPERVGVLP